MKSIMRSTTARSRCQSLRRCLGLGLGLSLLLPLLAGCGGGGTKPPQAPVVRVLTPNGGEQIQGGGFYTITWTATDGDTPAASLSILLEYSIDNGTVWVPIATAEINDGEHQWSVPSASTTLARIRITASDGQATASDQSDASFTILFTPPPPPPQSRLIVGDGEGAPLSLVTVSLTLDNEATAIHLRTMLVFDPDALEFVRGEAAGRGLAFDDFTAGLHGSDSVLVAFPAQAQVAFAPQSSVVATITFRLLGSAGTESDVTPRSTVLLDTNGNRLSVTNVAGTIEVSDIETAESLTRDGWLLFEAGNFTGALDRFDLAIVLDEQYGPAYTGRGWSKLQLATAAAEFQEALSAFDAAIARQQTLADARGGRAAALLALGGAQLQQAAAEAAAAALPDPLFSFAHRTSFNISDIYLIEAFAQAGRGRITDARDAADRITPSGIRSGDPNTWRVDGVAYPSFEAAVLAFLNKVSNTHAG